MDGQLIHAATESLTIGHRTKHPVSAPSGAQLLAAGSVISEATISSLVERGISHVTAHRDDVTMESGLLAESELDLLTSLDELCGTVFDGIATEGQPLLNAVKSHGCKPYSEENYQQLRGRFSAATSAVGSMVGHILDGEDQDSIQLDSIAINCAGDLAKDGDHAISVGEELGTSVDISQRSVRMATLAVGAAIRLGFDLAQVREVGVCALVHDWGWRQLPPRLQDPDEQLTEGDWVQVMKHPAYTVDCLRRVEGLSETVSIVAYQVHEQLDGSGYPNRLEGSQIHQYAKLINVVDQYLFLTSRSCGRPAIVPYDAMEYLLHQTKLGRYDSGSVRALIELLSLFPIGSHAELDDGRPVVILRQNGNDFTKPVVQLISPDAKSLSDEGQIFDLADSELRVARPITSPGRKQMRLDKMLMQEVIWHGPDA